jgi:hypothetical protein
VLLRQQKKGIAGKVKNMEKEPISKASNISDSVYHFASNQSHIV